MWGAVPKEILLAVGITSPLLLIPKGNRVSRASRALWQVSSASPSTSAGNREAGWPGPRGDGVGETSPRQATAQTRKSKRVRSRPSRYRFIPTASQTSTTSTLRPVLRPVLWAADLRLMHRAPSQDVRRVMESGRRIVLVVRVSEAEPLQKPSRAVVVWVVAREETIGVEPAEGVLDHGGCCLSSKPALPLTGPDVHAKLVDARRRIIGPQPTAADMFPVHQ